MKKNLFKKASLIQTKNIIIIFVAISLLIIISAVIEYYQTKSELYKMMEEHSHVLLESIVNTSENAILSSDEIIEQVKLRLLTSATFIKLLYESHEITNKILHNIAESKGIDLITINDKKGKNIFSSKTNNDIICEPDYLELLFPIFTFDEDTLIFGMKIEECNFEYRYIVALSTSDGNAICLQLNGEEIIEIRKKIGFGSLIKNLVKNEDIIFLALQDTNSILAGSGNVKILENINDSPFLMTAINDSAFSWRILENDSIEVFESVHPFYFNDRLVGLFRLGLSLEPMNALHERIIRRMIIIGLILITLGSVILIFIFTRQNFFVLQNKFKSVEDYSTKIIENVSDAIIVLDENNNIKMFNKSAENVFGVLKENAISKNLNLFFTNEVKNKIIKTKNSIFNIDTIIDGLAKSFLISKAYFTGDDNFQNLVLVISDLTDQRKLETQIQRQERMTAMGQLASGVAHEIRNPLNAIGTITQQLNKDFLPMDNVQEYKNLTSLVYKEVKRINETIQNFLKFARPEKINPTQFKLSELLKDLNHQYQKILNQKKIEFIIQQNWDGEVCWDREQIYQALINLIENAIDAIIEKGNIKLIVLDKDIENLILRIIDSGKGIEKELLPKIFNLYFTTKAEGTGIGLAIVQKIIYEHNGIISVESDIGKGTTFIIELPKTCK
ncbi:MAG: PAS domain S-box protein [Ignavibacteriales bacterium]|nr:PAS domain S-box protein [Ignavibacteriales bacterium]